MAFLLGFVIRENKKFIQALSDVKGFGVRTSTFLMLSLGVSKFLKFKEATTFQVKRLLRVILLLELVYGPDLDQKIFKRREVLRLIKHRRALRFFKGLPVRGQRTKTNAQTAKKKSS